MAQAAISIVAQQVVQQCYDALTPAQKTDLIFALASGAVAQVRT